MQAGYQQYLTQVLQARLRQAAEAKKKKEQ